MIFTKKNKKTPPPPTKKQNKKNKQTEKQTTNKHTILLHPNQDQTSQSIVPITVL